MSAHLLSASAYYPVHDRSYILCALVVINCDQIRNVTTPNPVEFREAPADPGYSKERRRPTPVFLPGESQGQQGLVGCRLWGHTESDMTEAT